MTDRTPARPVASITSIARSGAGAVALHPLRSVVTVVCVVALTLPYLVGLGIADGLRAELIAAVDAGPDLHVTAERYGRPAPMPLAAGKVLRELPGVSAVVPRVVGELHLGTRDETAVVAGLPATAVPAEIIGLEGRMFAAGALDELVLGSELAARLGLHVGSKVLPFYRNEEGERVSTVVGVFQSDGPLWQSHVMLVSLETAWNLFAEKDTATSFLVRCPPTFREPVAQRIRALATLGPQGERPLLRPRVVTRDDVEAQLLRRVLDRETLFQAPFILAFAVGIPLLLVTSGAGLVERRREVGLLRALGWSPDALLFRAVVESALLAVAGAAIAILLAFVWMRWFDGVGIAPILLPGSSRAAQFRIPWRMGAVPVLLGVLVSAVIVAAGTLHSTWRAASAEPVEAMR